MRSKPMSAEVNPDPYQTCSISRTFALRDSRRYPYQTREMAFHFGAPVESIEALCQDAESIARACGFSTKLNENEQSHMAKSGVGLYVIAAPGHHATKIGVSYSPVDRFADLQGAHWTELKLHAVIWSLNKRAVSIEQEALRKAAKIGKRLNGEWVDMTPSEAFALVLHAAKMLDVPICDSATWMQNWTVRMHALAEAKRYWDQSPRNVLRGTPPHLDPRADTYKAA